MKRVNRTRNPETPFFVKKINWYKNNREKLRRRFIDARPLLKCRHCKVLPKITKVRESKNYYRYDISCPICRNFETSGTRHYARFLWDLRNLD